VDGLRSLEGTCRCDSLVLAFGEAIGQKSQRNGAKSLTVEERVVLAVEALEREVNNGGYGQFFINSSREFAPTIVDALQRIGGKKTASITQKAIKAVGVEGDLTTEAIDAAMATDNELSPAWASGGIRQRVAHAEYESVRNPPEKPQQS
jgi:hypothetical protein